MADITELGIHAVNMWDHLAGFHARGQEPVPAPPRGIVSQGDACEALLLAAMAVERAATKHEGQLQPGDASTILASLMVARDYVLSLPAAGHPDPVTDDLRAMVETFRLVDIERFEFGGNAMGE